MNPANDEKSMDDLLEEFDEKTKILNEEDFSSKDTTVKTDSINTKDMDHIFNQFNNDEEGLNTTTSAQEDTVKRPSITSNELQIIAEDTPQQEIPFDFNRFLEQMRHRNSKPITRYFKSFLQAFDRRTWAVNEQIKIIQDFLDFIFVKMREIDVWRDMTEQEFGNAKEGMEKLVMNRLYHLTFCPNTTDDKERDEILYQKISIFRWIRETHLDIPETEHNESFLSFAESEILKINNYKAPRDKLICILNCCKVIFGLIKHVEGDAGADKFLPILIYVVIRANPPRLISNTQYIYRFRNSEQLQAESGYYLTNLMGAISFIENMEAKSLSITKEEFDNNIERTMNELKQERPLITSDKQQVSYENALHPSRSSSSIKTTSTPQPLLLDSAKAAALLEKGSQFAQKTMQRPLSFVGKIFQGLSENTSSAGSSQPESPTDDYLHQQHGQYYNQQQQEYYNQQHQQQHLDQQQQYFQQYHAQQVPNLPPRPTSSHENQIMMQQQQQFDKNLSNLVSMFSNVDNGVCYLVLHANGGDLSKSIDNLLDMSSNNGNTSANDNTTHNNTSSLPDAFQTALIQPTIPSTTTSTHDGH